MSKPKPQKPMTPEWLASIVSAATSEDMLRGLGFLELREDRDGRLYSARLPDYQIRYPEIIRYRSEAPYFDAPYGGFAARIHGGRLFQGDNFPSDEACERIAEGGLERIEELEERIDELRLFVRLAGGKA